MGERTLYLEADDPGGRMVSILKALGSRPRLEILRLLADADRPVGELARMLGMPPSTVAAQVRILEEAALLRTELRPAAHGLQKVCLRVHDKLLVELPYPAEARGRTAEVSMPIGAYSNFEVAPTCGLAGEDSLIGYIDDPFSFYEPDRVRAGLLWFGSGWVEYRFPSRLPDGAAPARVAVSMELCSEAPRHDPTRRSDITLWINGREVGAWTSAGDFGGQRGRLTPRWWNKDESQFGHLKRWTVTHEGAFVDGHRLSSLTVRDLGLERQRLVTVRVGVKPDALNAGGLNLFGRSFGNYPQDILLELEYAAGPHWTDGPEPADA